MSMNSYLWLTASQQGVIEGSSTSNQNLGAIEVNGWQHEIATSPDTTPGRSRGRAQHKPFVIIKPVDKSSPKLYKALVNGEAIGSWRLRCWRSTDIGDEDQYYTIEIENAYIVGIAAEQPNNQYPDYASLPIREQVSFNYESISWTWEPDGSSTTAQAVSVR